MNIPSQLTVQLSPYKTDLRDDSFCVPSAISAVTGLTRGQVSDLIFLNRNKTRKVLATTVSTFGQRLTTANRVPVLQEVQGVRITETNLLIRQLGFRDQRVSLRLDYSEIRTHYSTSKYGYEFVRTSPNYRTLNWFAKEISRKEPDTVFLIGSATHLMAIQEDKIIDSKNREGISVKQYGSRTRIHDYNRVGKCGEVLNVRTDLIPMHFLKEKI